MPVRQLETLPAEPFAPYGNIRLTTDRTIIRKVVGDAAFFELEMLALEAMFPDFPEIGTVFPALSFNTSERAKLTFYDRVDMGKVEDDTPDVRNWGRKFPDDGGQMYQVAARLCKWT